MSNISGNWNGIALSGQTYTLEMDRGSKPTPAPKSLIATTAVQTKDGWLSQIVIDGEIVQELGPFEDSNYAMERANGVVVERIKGLFA